MTKNRCCDLGLKVFHLRIIVGGSREPLVDVYYDEKKESYLRVASAIPKNDTAPPLAREHKRKFTIIVCKKIICDRKIKNIMQFL